MIHMAQSLTAPEVSDAGSRKGSRRGLFFGVVVGVVATLVLLSVAWGAKQVFSSDARTFTTTCSGANVTGTIWVHDAGVFISVAVVDPKARTWDIGYDGYRESVADSIMISTSDADYTGSLVSASQMLGDTDDGGQRTVQVRPHGREAWCAVDMHVSSLW